MYIIWSVLTCYIWKITPIKIMTTTIASKSFLSLFCNPASFLPFTPIHPTHPQEATNLLYVFTHYFRCSRICINWIIKDALFCLIYSTKPIYSENRPCFHMYQEFTSFYHRRIFHCVVIPQFASPLICWWILPPPTPVWGTYTTAINILAQVLCFHLAWVNTLEQKSWVIW